MTVYMLAHPCVRHVCVDILDVACGVAVCWIIVSSTMVYRDGVRFRSD